MKQAGILGRLRYSACFYRYFNIGKRCGMIFNDKDIESVVKRIVIHIFKRSLFRTRCREKKDTRYSGQRRSSKYRFHTVINPAETDLLHMILPYSLLFSQYHAKRGILFSWKEFSTAFSPSFSPAPHY